MSKSINNNYNNVASKNIYNEASLSLDDATILQILNSSGIVPTSDQYGAVATSGNQVFGVIAADNATMNSTTILQKLLLGDGGLFQIIPEDRVKINESLVYNVLLTTNQYADTGSVGYTAINFNVPYVFNDPDHVPNPANKEAPDNYLNIINSKFKVSGPITSVESIKTTFTAPIITLNYFDRPDASSDPANTLKMKKWEEGIVMERVEQDQGEIKFSFMGYSQPLDRFVFYKTGKYTGTEPYNYINKDGTLNSNTGILNEYNIDRIHLDLTDPLQNPNDIVTKVDIDSLFINDINSADHTSTRKLNINSYDDLTITVGSDPTEGTVPGRNYDYNLTVQGKTTITGNGTSGIKITGKKNVTMESGSALYLNPGSLTDPTINSIPIYAGNMSTFKINNNIQTNYLSAGISNSNITPRNKSTVLEIGGIFDAPNLGRSTLGLIDGTINAYGIDDSHLMYFSGGINIPDDNLNISSTGTTNVSNVTLRPIDLTIGTNSKVQRSSTLCVTGSTSNADENYSIYCDQGIVKFKGPNNSYMSWQDDALNLFNARIYVNPQPGSFVPYIEIGTTGKQTAVYSLSSLPDVSGTAELYVDGISTQIPMVDGTALTITGVIGAIQAGNIGYSGEIKGYITIINSIKTLWVQSIHDIHNPYDSVTGERLFDFTFDYTGDIVNFIGGVHGVGGDRLRFTGYSYNGLPTRWIATVNVQTLSII